MWCISTETCIHMHTFVSTWQVLSVVPPRGYQTQHWVHLGVSESRGVRVIPPAATELNTCQKRAAVMVFMWANFGVCLGDHSGRG